MLNLFQILIEKIINGFKNFKFTCAKHLNQNIIQVARAAFNAGYKNDKIILDANGIKKEVYCD